MVSSSGDPMVFIPLKDAQEAQFLKDNDAIWQSRRRTEANPAFNRPGVPGLLDAVIASQSTTRSSTRCWSGSSRVMRPTTWPTPSGAGSG
jgi:putative ABC transport system permease protein